MPAASGSQNGMASGSAAVPQPSAPAEECAGESSTLGEFESIQANALWRSECEEAAEPSAAMPEPSGAAPKEQGGYEKEEDCSGDTETMIESATPVEEEAPESSAAPVEEEEGDYSAPAPAPEASAPVESAAPEEDYSAPAPAPAPEEEEWSSAASGGEEDWSAPAAGSSAASADEDCDCEDVTVTETWGYESGAEEAAAPSSMPQADKCPAGFMTKEAASASGVAASGAASGAMSMSGVAAASGVPVPEGCVPMPSASGMGSGASYQPSQTAGQEAAAAGSGESGPAGPEQQISSGFVSDLFSSSIQTDISKLTCLSLLQRTTFSIAGLASVAAFSAFLVL